MSLPVLLIGYSGHAFVVADTLQASGRLLSAYCDREEKSLNPFGLAFLGPETGLEAFRRYAREDYFIAIGDNKIRARIQADLRERGLEKPPCNAVHPSAVVSRLVRLSSGIYIGAGAVVNPLAEIGEGVICNTSCVVEHECHIGAYAHIAPGAVLAGNVWVGDGVFVGANAVVRQGIRIGHRAVIGAGAVIVKNVEEGATVVGNPGR